MAAPESKPRSRFGKIHLDALAATARSLSSAFSHRDVADLHAHASTPPIAMPSPVVSVGWQGPYNQENTAGGLPAESASARFSQSDLLSPIEAATRARKMSISFDPTLKLDGGHQAPLQSRLPRPSDAPSVAVREYFDAPAQQATSLPPRASEYHSLSPNVGGITGSLNSRSGIQQNDDSNGSGGGELNVPLSGSMRRTRPRRRSSAAQRFLQNMSVTPTQAEMENDRAASLTSDSTMSPLSEGLHTPSPPATTLTNLFTDRDHLALSPEALPEPSQWPWSSYGCMDPNKPLSAKGSLRSRSGARRTLSARSANSTHSSKSPASMFLQSFNSGPTPSSLPDDEGQEVGNYVLGKQIGHGGFSVVKEAFTLSPSGKSISHAVKIVRKNASPSCSPSSDADADFEAIQASFDQEVQLWRCLSHENILRLELVYDTPFATFAFMQLNRGGSLFDLLRKNRAGISARLAQRYSQQLACALRYLHEDMRIVHGDIKLENCLVDTSRDPEDGGNLLLCDFGMARFIKSVHDEEDLPPSTSAPSSTGIQQPRPAEVGGSLQYAAPEMISAANVSPASDMWAFAVVVYTLHTGSLPFNHSLLPKLQDMILRGEWDAEKLRKCWGLLEAGRCEADKVVEVVKGTLNMDVNKRWNVRDVLESRWLERFDGESP